MCVCVCVYVSVCVSVCECVCKWFRSLLSSFWRESLRVCYCVFVRVYV